MRSIPLIAVAAAVLAMIAGLASCGSDSDFVGPLSGSQPIIEGYSAPRWGLQGVIVAAHTPFDTEDNPMIDLSGYWTLKPDGTEKQPYLVGQDYIPSSSAVWSPDGRWLAFDANYTDIYKMSREKDTLIPLSRRETKQLFPTWSPDGQWIAYAIVDGPEHEWGLWMVKADGSIDRPFRRPPIEERCPDCEGLDRWVATMPDWSPYGNEIVFVASTRGSSANDLAIYDTTSAHMRILHVADGGIRVPKFSPDGSKILFQTDPTESAMSQIFVINRDGSGLKRIVDGGHDPAWGPGGHQIVYVQSYSAPEDHGNRMLQVMNADGSSNTQITFLSR